MPAERPVTVRLSFAAVLFSPGPLTDTAVAFVLDHVIVELPGAVTAVGDALIAAENTEALVTATRAV